MEISDIADEIIRELDNPSDISIPIISFWLLSNLSQLNVLIGTSYVFDENDVVTPDIGDSEKAILKLLYFSYYFSKLIQGKLGAGAYDWSEITEGDSSIRRVSNNQIALSFLQIKKGIDERLNRMLILYKKGQVIPQSLSAMNNLVRFYRV